MGIRFFLLQISQKQQQNHQLRFLVAVFDAKKVETVSEFRCPANFRPGICNSCYDKSGGCRASVSRKRPHIGILTTRARSIRFEGYRPRNVYRLEPENDGETNRNLLLNR